MRTYRMYINGKFVDAADKSTLAVYEPATEDVMATVPAARQVIEALPRSRP